MSGNGGTIPLTPEFLLQALHAASSQSQELVHNASTQLKNWERTPGYWSLLQDAFLDRSLPVELRWIAIITLKQGIDKYWRKNANNSIGKDEKAHVRSRLISSSVDEPHAQLAIQNAVIVGKVARLEYPLDWPEVFNELTNLIRDSSSSSASNKGLDEASSLRLTRSLSILLHVVKELATGRLTRTKSNLQAVTPEVFRVLGTVYVQHVDIWYGFMKQQQTLPKTVEMMTISLLALKILRRLMIAGYEFPHRVEEVREFWSLLSNQIWEFLNVEKSLSPNDEAAAKLLRKNVVNMGKLFLDLAASHPAAFALMPGVLGLLEKYWGIVVEHGESLAEQSKRSANKNFNSDGEANQDSGSNGENETREFREKVALHGMLLFRNCYKMIFNPVNTFKYRHKAEKDETKTAVELLKTQLFTPGTVTFCMEVLVTKYFILRPADIEGWNEDPEAWSEQWENAVESWEFLVRPCAEKLFMDLVVNFKDFLAQPLMGVFNSLGSVEKIDILTKDAIYTAVGLAAPVLNPFLDFDTFLQNALIKEIQVSQPGYNIIRRRIAILIGQWVSVRCSDASRPTVYQVSQHLLNREDPLNDLVVRLTAARTLKKSVQEWEFRVEAFLPLVDDLFGKLMALIDEVEQTETRMGLLAVIGAIVERLEHRVVPYAERIVTILPPLWEQTGDEHLFKQAILAMFTKLVLAMNDKSLQYHSLVIPLIRFSVEPGSGMQVYLLEDALDLWKATIQSTPSPSPKELLDLVPYLLPCVELGTQTLKNVLDLIESYVLLAPREMVESYHAPMFDAFSSLLGALKPEANSIITNVVEMVIRAAEAMGGEQALSVIGREMIRSGFLGTIFDGIEKSYEAAQTSGPNKKYAPLNSVVMTDYFSVFSRMVLASSQWFVEVIRIVAEGKGQETDFTMKWLLDEWFRHFGNIGHPKQRKLNCLALTKLLETNQKWILERLQDLMTVWTDVVNELRDDEAGDALIYWHKPIGNDYGEPETPEKIRSTDLTRSDPVHAANVMEFIKHHLSKAQNENGGPDVFRQEWVVNVDEQVLADFAKLGLV